jgi:hypothetical protein
MEDDSLFVVGAEGSIQSNSVDMGENSLNSNDY